MPVTWTWLLLGAWSRSINRDARYPARLGHSAARYPAACETKPCETLTWEPCESLGTLRDQDSAMLGTLLEQTVVQLGTLGDEDVVKRVLEVVGTSAREGPVSERWLRPERLLIRAPHRVFDLQMRRIRAVSAREVA
eukprot:2061596-Rhodomonas_salina.1